MICTFLVTIASLTLPILVSCSLFYDACLFENVDLSQKRPACFCTSDIHDFSPFPQLKAKRVADGDLKATFVVATFPESILSQN